MSDKRLLYRVILKVLSAIGIIALLLVFLNATFYSNIETQEAIIDAEDIRVDISDMIDGSNKVVRWNNQRVGVIKHFKTQQLALVKASAIAPKATLAEIGIHPWRSLDPRFFIYFDVGDSGHCPLFLQKNSSEMSFKDTCSGNWFDAQGRFKSDGEAGLKIPPYHITDEGQLVIGRWLAE